MNSDNLESQIELLAAGELDHHSQAAVLKQLDQSPELWRQCALLLLEDRALRCGIANFAGAAERVDASTSQQANAPQKNSTRIVSDRACDRASVRNKRRSIAGIVALVTAVCISFICGWSLNHLVQRDSQVAVDTAKSGNQTSNEVVATENMSESKAATNARSVPRIVNSDGKEFDLLGYVKISDPDDPESLPFVTPIVRTEEDGAGLLNSPQSDVPNQFVEHIERSGWRMVNDRKLVSVRFADGDRIEFPLQQVRYQYVGRPIY